MLCTGIGVVVLLVYVFADRQLIPSPQRSGSDCADPDTMHWLQFSVRRGKSYRSNVAQHKLTTHRLKRAS